MQLKAMAEELAMQNKQNVLQEEDVFWLEDLLKISRDRHEQMQAMLQNNIKGTFELKYKVEHYTKDIMELEYNLGQKEAMLNRVTRDLVETTKRT
jgi:hypothetical protein